MADNSTVTDFLLAANVQSDSFNEKGLVIPRHFTDTIKCAVMDSVEWEFRTATIANESGSILFEQKNVYVPKEWSQTATNIVASRYFRTLPTGGAENSVVQLIDRVATFITCRGRQGGYFKTVKDADAFCDELCYLLLHQYAAFNSPVWFNVGIRDKPQCSACFINSVQDTMESILDLVKTEGLLFRNGSGSGTNFSSLRGSMEKLSGGGTSSGPVLFMRGLDMMASVTKSGGLLRRAAKMAILNIDHPDIVSFIESKVVEEKKAHVLIDAGYNANFNVPGGAYESVSFQNGNHSVRVTDAFMRAVEQGSTFDTIEVKTGKVHQTYDARWLFHKIAEAAHFCGDPGIQFHDTINMWNTCSDYAPIRASNPCSEFMFIDDSACNLASLNLLKFQDGDGSFDTAGFRAAIRIMIIAMDILVGTASYPTETIAKNSNMFRPLGLGYANLGALLMVSGLPYDSDDGRAYAQLITATMTGQAYLTSAELAAALNPFDMYKKCEKSMMKVFLQHLTLVRNGLGTLHRVPQDIKFHAVLVSLMTDASNVWEAAYKQGITSGFRNAQTTLLAPTGTIGFMMDCDTTGIEPEMALVKYKKLVGGGAMRIVDRSVPCALERLGYNPEEKRRIIEYINARGTVEGDSGLDEYNLSVFDCALTPSNGTRSIHYLGHLNMMAAVQPFLSGAISKTVNLPNTATVEDVKQVYMQAWKQGLKAVAIYRDGCKRTQPVATISTPKVTETSLSRPIKAIRTRLQAERQSITHKFSIGGHEGYLTVGMYADGSPGEVFITMSKEGSTISGMMDGFSTAISLALQYGVPLGVLVNKFIYTRFEPSGFTGNKDLPRALSICDYIFRWLALKFPIQASYTNNSSHIPQESVKEILTDVQFPTDTDRKIQEERVFAEQSDSPPCAECGSIMVRTGSCYTCTNCASTSGCA